MLAILTMTWAFLKDRAAITLKPTKTIYALPLKYGLRRYEYWSSHPHSSWFVFEAKTHAIERANAILSFRAKPPPKTPMLGGDHSVLLNRSMLPSSRLYWSRNNPRRRSIRHHVKNVRVFLGNMFLRLFSNCLTFIARNCWLFCAVESMSFFSLPELKTQVGDSIRYYCYMYR
jgi:hypothetical protein